ncbi:MAG TPA: polysaccharide biosynthesis tyrosine autokinase [Gemmatimonadales bacterium]|nr:polysaccharide biosynthesis tyrosine autokinase [Gemmatimonadales bacterium]
MSTSPLPLHAGSSLPAVAPAAAPPVGADMGFGQGFAQPETGVDWRRVWSAVARFKWLIAVVTILGTVGGLAATRFIKPQYMVQATLWIDQPDQRGGVDRGPIRAGQPLEPEAWLDLLKSYRVLDQVVRDRRLFLTPKEREDAPLLETFRVADQYRPGVYRLTVDGRGRNFTLSTDKGVEVEHGAVGDSIGVRLGFSWAPPAGTIPAGRTIEFSVATVRDSARALSDELEVATDPAGNFLRMHLKGADAARITSTINAIAERFVQVAAELRRQKLTELTKILDQQLAGAHQNLLDAEQALERFQVNTIARPSQIPKAGGTDDPAFTSFFKMQVDRDQVQRDREALERVLAQSGDSGLSAEALAVVGSVQQNVQLTQALAELTTKQAELRALRYKYADAYPLVQKRLGEIATLQRQTIPNLARQLRAELSGREAELGRRVTADSRTLQAVPPRAIDEARLQRQVTLAENLYTNLQKNYDEARLAEESAVPDARILDHAVMPQDPVRNTAPRVIFLGFAASLALGLCGAVVLDRIDPKVRYPDQVSRGLGIPILGAVPHLRNLPRGGRGGGARVPDDVNEVVEALRGVCLNLVYAHGGRAPLLVTITSPGAGDGKSFIAANLAHTFADGGHRTLLIDADIRRGVLHRRLSVRRRPGLSDFLRGEAQLDAIVQATQFPALSLIGCGTRAYNAPELLGSPAMTSLVNGLRSGYDVVLIDSPPLAAGVDPLILSTLTGTLALVLRTGYSHRDVAAAKLEVLQRLPVRMLGAVLNDVPAGGAYRYYSYYLPGYEAMDENSGSPRVPV